MAPCSQILKASKDCNIIVSLTGMFHYSLLGKQLVLVFSLDFLSYSKQLMSAVLSPDTDKIYLALSALYYK